MRLVAVSGALALVLGLVSILVPEVPETLSGSRAARAAAQAQAAAAPTPCPRAGFSPGSGIMWESDADLARDLDDMVSAGAQWIRLDFGWANMEPRRGEFRWTNTDRVVNAAVSRGLKIVAIIHLIPEWARAPGTDSIFYPPTDPADFATFAGATVRRYSNRVKVWEVMNEPNISNFWLPRPDAPTYTAILRRTYPAIKEADPGATVLLAGLSPANETPDGSRIRPEAFLRSVYENGGQGFFDAVGIHPYSYPKRPVDPTTQTYNTFHRLPMYYDLMVRNGDGDKKMWLTEYGAPTGAAQYSVTEAEQAAMVTDAFRAASQMPGVGGPLFIYSGRDAGTNPDDNEDNFGVLRRDFSAKPARAAFQQAAAACIPPQPASLSIGDASVLEGDSAGAPATFTITRSGDATTPASVRYATVDGTATAVGDFIAAGPTTVSFAAGETTKSVAVTVNGGVDPEADETFSVRLSSPTGATISDDTGLGTIVNDDAQPTLAIDDVAVPEGNVGTTEAGFTITRSGPTISASSVQYTTVDGTATATADFTAAGPTTVSFAAGETSKRVAIAIRVGLGTEPDETFSVRLSSPVGAVLSDDTGVGTILNDDDTRTYVSANDLSVNEGLLGAAATFTITRSGDTSRSASVQYATADGTATAGSDYTSVGPATASFAVGETTKTVAVPILADLANEPNETVLLNLSSASDAIISDAQAVATIVDDDILLGLLETPGPVTFMAVTDVLLTEGNSGTTAATFTIARTGIVTGSSSVQYATVAGTATAGSDFVSVPATTVSFAAGETTKTVTIGVNGDSVVEPKESFSVKLSSPSGGTIADDTGLAAIFNDDAPATVGISDTSVIEGNSGTTAATFTISRTGVVTGSSSVQYATVAGTATAGSDFVGVGATTVDFAAGETAKTVTVAVNGDTAGEPVETFSVRLSSATAATISDDTGVATIFDGDAPATVAVSDVAVPAGDTDTWAIFSVTRSGNTTGTSSVKYATAAGTATEGTDYVGLPLTTLSFAAEEKVKIVTVKVKAQAAPDETFSLNLSAPTGAAVADGQGGAEVVPAPTASAASSGARYNPLTPSRILDTRSGNGAPAAAVGPNSTLDLQVTGRGGVPASGVSAVVLNVTVTQPSGAGHLTVFPAGQALPVASNLNFTANQTVPNLVVVKLGTGGKVSLHNPVGSVHLIADLAGWYDDGTTNTGTRYNPLTPARILDTRDGTGAPAAVVGLNSTLDLQVTGRGGVPASGVSAVVLNVTVTQPSGAGHLTVFPAGQALPVASNLNFTANQTVPNLVVVKLGTGGNVSLHNPVGSVHLIADVAGWYDDGTTNTGTRYNPLTPARILDTRTGDGAPAAAVGPNSTLDLQVTGRGGVPASGVSAVVLNVTVTQPSGAGHLTVFPAGQALPVASNLNFTANQTVPNLVVVKLGTGGKVSLHNPVGSVHLIADVAGWYDGG